MSDNFDENSFWAKVAGYAKVAGHELVEKALWLYYAAQRPETPIWAKTMVFGALTYFVMPVDAIPDMLPGVGYTDDLGVLAMAVATLAAYINQDVKVLASRKMADWFQ